MRNASFVTLPKVIDEPGEYVTRCGETVMIEHINYNFGTSYQAFGVYVKDDIAERWDVSGRILPFSETNNDIVKKAG